MINKILSAFILLSLSLTVIAQPIAVSTSYVSSFASNEKALPSFITNSPEELVLQAVGKEVFSKLTTAQTEELKALCKEPDGAKKIAQAVVANLDEINFEIGR